MFSPLRQRIGDANGESCYPSVNTLRIMLCCLRSELQPLPPIFYALYAASAYVPRSSSVLNCLVNIMHAAGKADAKKSLCTILCLLNNFLSIPNMCHRMALGFSQISVLMHLLNDVNLSFNDVSKQHYKFERLVRSGQSRIRTVSHIKPRSSYIGKLGACRPTRIQLWFGFSDLP